jgi:predicted Zn-dependent peptidase
MLDSPSQVAEYFLAEELAGTCRHPLDRARELQRVTVDEVVATARRWLTPDELCLLLLGFPKRGAVARVERLVAEFR